MDRIPPNRRAAGNPGLHWARGLLVLVILAGAGLALRQAQLRHEFESANEQVELVADLLDLETLALKTGASIERLIEAAKSIGFTAVAIHEDTLGALEEKGRLAVFTGAELLSMQSVANLAHPALIEGMARDRNPDPVPNRTYLFIPDAELQERLCGDHGFMMHYFAYSPVLINDISLFERSPLPEGSGRLCRIPVIDKELFMDYGVGLDPALIRLVLGKGLRIAPRFTNAGALGNRALIARKLSSLDRITDRVSAVVFKGKEVLGHPAAVDATAEELKKRNLTFGRVEFAVQESGAALAAMLPENLVWVHSISEAEMELYLPRRYIERYVRAVRERSLRLIYLRTFPNPPSQNSGELLAANFEYWKQTIDAVTAAGFRTGPPPRLYGFQVDPGWTAGFIAAAAAAAALLASLVWPGAVWWLLGLTALAGAGLFSGTLSAARLALPAAQAAAVIFPLAVVWPLLKLEPKSRPLPHSFLLALLLWAGACAATICGGAILAALLAQGEFMLRIRHFSGVKLALILPPAAAFLALAARNQPGETYAQKLLNFIRTPLSKGDAAAALAALGLAAFYLLRSGNEPPIMPGDAEIMVRGLLEDAFQVRPRTKELFIGHPALILFLGLYLSRRRPLWTVLLLPLGIIGQASIMNTFCHFHSPIEVTAYRTGVGMLVGGGLGLAALFVVLLAQAVLDRVRSRDPATRGPRILLAGYLGMGNRGDDALAEAGRDALGAELPDAEFRALWGSEPGPDGVRLHDRGRAADIWRALGWADLLCFPGGSLLQDATSRRSLTYYLGLMGLARLRRCRVVMLGQGMGPLDSGSSRRRTARALNKTAGPMALRDPDSLCLLQELGVPGERLVLGADSLLLSDPATWGARPEAEPDSLRIGVALRPWDSAQLIASALADAMDKVEQELEGVDIQWVGIPLQEPEDRRFMEQFAVRPNWTWAPAEPGIHGLAADFGGVDLVVGMRLHSLISAMLRGVPGLGIAYDPKVVGFQTEWEGPCLDPHQAADPELMAQAVINLIRDRTAYSAALSEAAERLRLRARAGLAALIRDMGPPLDPDAAAAEPAAEGME